MLDNSSLNFHMKLNYKENIDYKTFPVVSKKFNVKGDKLKCNNVIDIHIYRSILLFCMVWNCLLVTD